MSTPDGDTSGEYKAGAAQVGFIRPNTLSMIQFVLLALTPVLGHVPTPRNSSTMS